MRKGAGLVRDKCLDERLRGLTKMLGDRLLEFEVNEMVSQESEAKLRKLAADEFHTHAMRYGHLGHNILRNIPWTILIAAMNSELRRVELTAIDVAAFENVPESVVLRWANILAEDDLMTVQNKSDGKYMFSLREKGRSAMTDYLTSLDKSDG